MTILINNIFLQGIFPNCLKIAKVIVLHKGGNYEDPSNFRPISIVSQFSKIIEKLLKCRLNSFISKYSLINTSQYGFMNKISTEDALLDLTNSIITKKHKITSVISIDIKKAFDCINHNILLKKLCKYGFRGRILSLLTSYLSNRKQYVSNNDASSKLNSIKYGVPQGSVLGPILFILYINDIVNISNECKYILFADDTTLVFSNENSIQLELSMNKVLLQLRNWLVINKLTINLLKTSYIIFNKPKLKFIITLDNIIIARSRSIKFLGLIIDDKLSWKQQFNNVKKKLYYGIATLGYVN